ncbi:hypothetical protein K457DRAFT_145557 [Linnemannia elongata AG-77]|uniref:Amino acid transporter transmembrane domain-containing protein n=1 Tax=Linnemannia elongata AG-77 TaxID=1314771 RepID=A0A197JZC5_9FUNG|nr:hypothetical protein K457DRAFT_145557 [Linnemannia elongata AG-77]
MSSTETSPLLSNSSLYEVTKPAPTDHNCSPDLLAERPEQGSSFAAYAVVVCIVAGSGTLGLPYALKLGGWIGVGVLVLSLLMSVYTAVLLVRCLYYDGVHRLSSYQEVGRHAFGKVGLWTVWFFYATTVIGGSVMFLILAGTGLKPMFTLDISARSWIWICAIIVAVPFVLIKTMKEAAITSVLGALATVVLVVVAVRGSILDLDNPVYADVNHSLVIFSHLPTAVASISICFGGNVIYVHVEESMRRLCTCTIFYLAVAIPCYMAYGDLAESPIFNNLPKDGFRTIGTIFIIAHVLLTAPLLLTLFALEIERLADITVCSRGLVMERVYRTVLRLVMVGFCACIACTVPYFGDFLSLLGALSQCTLIFVLPVVFYAKLFGWRQMRWFELVWCATIVVIGIVSAVIGSIDAIQALKDDFENDPTAI